MTDKNKSHDSNCFSPQESDALNNDLKHYGYLLPTNEEEEEEFEKIYGGTQVLIPEKFNTPDFLFEKESKSKIVTLKSDTKKTKTKKISSKKATVKKIDKNTYFKRLVLAAEIANQLYEEPTFGHVKFVKIQYLCERIFEMEINTNYGQYAAGPLDPKHIYSIDAEFKRRKWFKVIKTKYGGYKYEPDQNVDSYKTYFPNYFSKQIDNINYIIDLFRKEKSDFCEIVATLFAVWERRLTEGKSNEPEELFKDFYSWSKEKARFVIPHLEAAIVWMKEKGIVPITARS